MKKTNNSTELVFILDKSGSMCGLSEDTIGGFNSMLEAQKKENGECFVSTVFFNDRSSVIHDRLPIDKVEPITSKDYMPCGSTALLDALGDAIKHIGNIHKYARPEDVPSKTIFVITTDGYENSSYKYSSNTIKKLITNKQEKYGWEFMFIAANIDAIETANDYGIRKKNAVNYKADKDGTKVVYNTVSNAVCFARASSEMDEDWSKDIREDYNNRK